MKRKTCFDALTWLKTADSLYKIQKKRRELERVEEGLKNQLKVLSDYQTTQVGNYIFIKTTAVGHVDYSTIPQLRGVNLEIYRKPSVERFQLIKEVIGE